MDQTDAVQAIIGAYGGSDPTTPSFNRTRYVRYASVHKPRDFGEARELNLDLQGEIGAESGAQSIFFRVRTLEEARIGMRRVKLNYWTDQYITLSLQGESGPIALGADGFADSQIVDLQALEILSPPALIDIGYVDCGYWETGYCEFDCQFTESSSAIVLGAVEDASLPLRSPFGALMPPGEYRFVVTSSQWPKLPYRIQIAVVPQPDLAATIEMQSLPSARLSLSPTSAEVAMEASIAAHLVQTPPLQSTIESEALITATLERLSPYG